MLKIDVNKSGQIFDFLVVSGILSMAYDVDRKGLGPGKEGYKIQVQQERVAEIYPGG
jgi:transcriptional adapter 2-alpha